MFLGVDQDKSVFLGSSGGTSGFGLQIGTVPTRSRRLASMLRYCIPLLFCKPVKYMYMKYAAISCHETLLTGRTLTLKHQRPHRPDTNEQKELNISPTTANETGSGSSVRM